MNYKTEQFIFETGTEDSFYDFMHDFHEVFENKLVMTGSGSSNARLEDIKMVTMGHGDEHCADIIKCMKHEQPTIHVCLQGQIRANMYALDNMHDVRGVYMLQQTIDYPKKHMSLYSVWMCTAEEQQLGMDVLLML